MTAARLVFATLCLSLVSGVALGQPKPKPGEGGGGAWPNDFEAKFKEAGGSDHARGNLTKKFMPRLIKAEALHAEATEKKDWGKFNEAKSLYAQCLVNLRYDFLEYQWGRDLDAKCGFRTYAMAQMKKLYTDNMDMVEQHLAKQAPLPEMYKGDDTARVRELALAEWAKHYPEDEVLGLAFTGQAWKREVKAYSGKLYDTSKLDFEVYVPYAPGVVMGYTCWAKRDNLDSTYTFNVHESKPETGDSSDFQAYLASNVSVGGGGGGVLSALAGLCCCFLFLAALGGGGFFAYKQMQAKQAAAGEGGAAAAGGDAPPPAPTA